MAAKAYAEARFERMEGHLSSADSRKSESLSPMELEP